MAEVLVQFTESGHLRGRRVLANACGAPTSDGLWQGWIEFTPMDGGPTFDPVARPRSPAEPQRSTGHLG